MLAHQIAMRSRSTLEIPRALELAILPAITNKVPHKANRTGEFQIICQDGLLCSRRVLITTKSVRSGSLLKNKAPRKVACSPQSFARSYRVESHSINFSIDAIDRTAVTDAPIEGERIL